MWIDIIRDIFFGCLQALTEFLPISSSGHLQIFKYVFKHTGDVNAVQSTLTYDVFLHFGTLLAVLIVFRSKLSIFVEGMRGILERLFKQKTTSALNNQQRYFVLIAVGSVPIFIAGYFLKDEFAFFTSPLVLAGGYLISSIFLLSTAFPRFNQKKKDKMDETSLSLRPSIVFGFALLVGLGQMIAIVPGVSRSGVTIATALMLGVDRKFAGEFSFLLAIPAISAAFLVSALEIPMQAGWHHDFLHYGIGAAVSMVVGFIALKLLFKLVKQGKFYWFGFYTLGLALFCGYLATLS